MHATFLVVPFTLIRSTRVSEDDSCDQEKGKKLIEPTHALGHEVEWMEKRLQALQTTRSA